MDRRQLALEIWQAGVAAVGGYTATKRVLTAGKFQKPDQIVAVGKAAGTMMRAALDFHSEVPALVVTKDGHGDGLPPYVRLIEAAHPVPDARSLAAGQALRETVAGMGQSTHILLLVSGGASSLAEDLVEGKTLKDLQALNQKLLSQGLDIGAMNAQRRLVSRIKAGRLLGHFRGGSVQVLVISDVPGDALADIGSGIGCTPNPFGFEYEVTFVGSNTTARNAAARSATEHGLTVLANQESLHDDLEVLARKIGKRIRDMGKGVMIFGGEPTVVLPPNPGRGGRNQALALALAHEISGIKGLTVIVAGTDGSDGPTNAAGGIVDGATWGPAAAQALERADSGTFLEQSGALLTTGPTGTNVMDLLVAIRD